MRGTICGFVLLLSLAAPVAPQNPAADSIPSMITALEYSWNQAAEHRDTKALDMLLDDSLVIVTRGGKFMSKAEYLALLKIPALDTQQQGTESMTVMVYDHSAIFRAAYRATGVNNGKPFSIRGWAVDTWVNRNGHWVCVASQGIPMSQ